MSLGKFRAAIILGPYTVIMKSPPTWLILAVFKKGMSDNVADIGEVYLLRFILF